MFDTKFISIGWIFWVKLTLQKLFCNFIYKMKHRIKDLLIFLVRDGYQSHRVSSVAYLHLLVELYHECHVMLLIQ